MYQKACRKCGKVKTDDEFYISKRNRDGLQSYCKDCSREISGKYYEAHKERVLEQQRQYYKNRNLKKTEVE